MSSTSETPIPCALTPWWILWGGAGKAGPLQVIPTPAGEMLLTHADLTKARRVLGYSPKVSFEDGIHRFAAWLKSRRLVPQIHSQGLCRANGAERRRLTKSLLMRSMILKLREIVGRKGHESAEKKANERHPSWNRMPLAIQ